MGPVRRRLSAALVALPSPAAAEVCGKNCPDRAPTDGPLSAWEELAFLRTTPFGGALIALSATAALWPRRWLIATCGLGALAGAAVLGWAADMPALAQSEGCVGPQALAFGVVALLPLPGLLRLLRR
jgi:hypothetical protein